MVFFSKCCNSTDVVDDAVRFCNDARCGRNDDGGGGKCLGNPDNLINKVMPHLDADGQASLKAQMQTFPADMQRVKEGKMSYAEMRGLYG